MRDLFQPQDFETKDTACFLVEPGDSKLLADIANDKHYKDLDFLILETKTLRAQLDVAKAELRNIATRGNNCECASHGWAKLAVEKLKCPT